MTNEILSYDCRHGVDTPVENFKDLLKVGDKVFIHLNKGGYKEVNVTKVNRKSIEIAVKYSDNGQVFTKKVNAHLTTNNDTIRSNDILIPTEMGKAYMKQIQQRIDDQAEERHHNHLRELMKIHKFSKEDLEYMARLNEKGEY